MKFILIFAIVAVGFSQVSYSPPNGGGGTGAVNASTTCSGTGVSLCAVDIHTLSLTSGTIGSAIYQCTNQSTTPWSDVSLIGPSAPTGGPPYTSWTMNYTVLETGTVVDRKSVM